MFTYPITTSASSYVSAFDDAVAALNPAVWYKLTESSFASIIDHGSVGTNLTNNNSVNASAGTALRTTRGHSMYMPQASLGVDNRTETCSYSDDGSFGTSYNSGGDPSIFTFMYSINHPAYADATNTYFFRLGDNYSAAVTPMGFECYMNNPLSTGTISGRVRVGTSTMVTANSTGTQQDDSVTRLVVIRASNNVLHDSVKRSCAVNGTVETSSTGTTSPKNSTSPFHLNVSASTASMMAPWYTDTIAFWPSWISDADISALWALYQAEIV